MLKKLAFMFMMVLCWQVTVSAQTYIQENFDTGLPATWVITDGGTTTDTWMGTTGGRGGSYLNGTSEFLIADSDAAGAGVTMSEIITTPAFNSSAGATVYLDFSHFYQTYTGADTALVQVFDGTAWQTVATFTATNVGAFGNPDMQHIDITAYKNAAMQVRFVYTNAVYEWYWCIDDVNIYATSCPPPSNLGVTNLTSTSADLTWVAGGTETSWDIEWDTAGFTQGTGTMITGTTTNPYSLTGLMPNTAYSYYIVANCGGSSSLAAGPFSFTTPCSNITPDYIESFDAVSTTVFDAADCWSMGTGQLDVTSTVTPSSTGWAGKPYLNAGGSVAAYTNLYNNPVGQWLISPSIDLGAGNGYHLEFDIGATLYNGTAAANFEAADSFAVVISPDNGVTWSTVNILQAWTQGSEPSSTGNHIDIDLSSYSGVVKFAFYAVASVPVASDFDLFVEDFMVRTPPACPPPTDLTLNALTSTTADLAWTAGGAEVLWDVEWDTAGFTQGAGNMVAATDTFQQITGLMASTTYSFYVRANCGTSQSTWVGPFTFTTPCNPFMAPYMEGFEDPANLSCWSVARTSPNYSWFSNTGPTPTGAGVNVTGPTGASIPAVATDTVYMYAEASAPAAPNDVARLQSPAIDLSMLTTPELRFEYHMAGADITLLYIQVDDGSGYVTVDSIIGQQQTAETDPWLTKVVDLSAYSGTIEIGFLTVRGASFNGDVSIDDVSVDNAPVPPLAQLMFTEIMYNTPSFDTAEFIEIYNNGPMPVDLTGYTVGTSISYTFTGGTIAAGGYYVITDDSTNFHNVYGFAADGEWNSGQLTNTTGSLNIYDNFGRLVDTVGYEDGGAWPSHPDGDGSSAVLCDTTSDNNLGVNWSREYTDANTTINGVAIFASPGAPNNCSPLPMDDVSASAFIGLNSSYCNQATLTAQVVITNNTSNPVTNVPYSIEASGFPIAAGTVPTLAGNASDTITVGPVPLTTGVATVVAYTSMAGDTDMSNDTIMQAIAVSNMTAAISGSTNVSCNGGMDGTATAMGSDGLGAYTFMWTPSSQTTFLATGLAANTYEVVIADTTNCMDTAMVTITEPTAVSVTIADNGDGSATATGTGGTVAAGYMFMWDATAGSQTTATATGLMSGSNYCVTVTDDNGCTGTNCVTVIVTGIEDVANANAFKVYPNPTTDKVFVELGLTTPTDVQLTVFNAIGENVMSKQLNGQAARIELSTAELPTGVYMMQFAIENEVSTQKLIIQRP